jgi:ribosomal-protein-alanine N-acetyltransferase
MALLKSSVGHDLGPIVRGRRVVLRSAAMNDYAAWAELRALSREHLRPWEPSWARDELSRSAFRRRVRHYQREAREDLGYAFLIFAAHDGGQETTALARERWGVRALLDSAQAAPSVLVGGITLSNVRRGVTQAASMGYWLGSTFVGRGLMSDAVNALLPFAFDVLRLHRVEAAVLPHNLASIKVLERAGFEFEGLARRFLKINGVWEDHKTYAVLAEDMDRRAGVRP